MSKKSGPGWWPDPGGSGRLRWWDGEAWTKRLRDLPPEPEGDGDDESEWAPPTLPDEAATGPDDEKPKARAAWVVPVVAVLAALAVVGLIAGAFLIGQGTRKSDEQVAKEKRAAVAAAVLATQRADAAEQKRVVKRVREKQKRRTRVVVRRVVRKLKKSSERKAQQSYASGSAQGYSNGRQEGYDAGTVDGATKATDQVTCSDDPDVTWLPFC